LRMSVEVAVVGATGNVGREILNILFERQFPAQTLHALASERSIGREISYGPDTIVKVQNLKDFDFNGIDIAFFCAGSTVAKEYAKKVASKGTVVIDKSSLFRLEPGIPLIVPEVNLEQLKLHDANNIIASPNCVTIPLVMALKPLHEIATIKRVVLSTYQSTSGAGKEAMDELFAQTRAVYVNDPITPEVFSKVIAFNVIPQIGGFEASGDTEEETKIAMETRKILAPSIKVTATCVRVPVFIGHALSVNIEFEQEIGPDQARKALEKMPGVWVIDRPEAGNFVTPIEIVGEDNITVSRIRKDPTVAHGLNMWIVGDNLRKGAALNAVQIAENILSRTKSRKK
jgi:aspartate-semialdehyde dehydrogenase